MTEQKEIPAGVEERYTEATNADDLTVKDGRPGDADVIIASGMSRSRLGGALMRLHGEWDGAEKPQKLSARGLELLAEVIAKEEAAERRQPVGKLHERHHAAARRQAAEWLHHENKLLLGKLKTLPAVRRALEDFARDRLTNPEAMVAASLMWWLDPICPVCDGRRWQTIPGTPKLSQRPCEHCKGEGIRAMAHPMQMLLVIRHIKECLHNHRQSLQSRLLHFKGRQS